MLSRIEYIRAWNSRVGNRTLHFNIKNFTKEDRDSLYEQYKMILDNYNLENKTIADYGCGGGLLGNYLYINQIDIKKYIGIDIVDKCLHESRLNNSMWNHNVEVEINKINPYNFNLNIKADILIILNLIRYFPDKEYIDFFFNEINISKIKEVFLNFRNAKNNIFRKKPYKTTHDIGNANFLDVNYVIDRMNKYNVKNIINKDGECYIFFEKRKRRTKKVENINDNSISD